MTVRGSTASHTERHSQSGPVASALVVGGGCAGTCAAIQLRKIGIAVDLVERNPAWGSYGAGISISGPSLRALETVGVLDQVLARGRGSDGLDVFSADGRLLASLPTPRIAGPHVPSQAGIMRPALAAILEQATRDAGARVRLGRTVRSFVQTPREVTVIFDDGERATYGLVVGADGLFSRTREMLLPGAPRPEYSGQAVWRAVFRTPPEITKVCMFMGARTKVGFNPVSADEMYMFVTENRPVNEHLDPQQFVPQLSALLAPFEAPVVREVRASLGPDAKIVFRPLEGLLVPPPWSKGRVVLIGDAVHATTPHLASGAGIGFEDAIVLAEELERASSVETALERFERRRWERCRLVVENSRRLGEIEATGGSQEEHTRLMQETMSALAQPI